MSSRIGVDIGGTVTDFIFYDEMGKAVIIDKIPTTPSDPELAVMEVVKRNLNKEELSKVDFFLHDTKGIICSKTYEKYIFGTKN